MRSWTGIVVIAANEDMFVFARAITHDKNRITRLRLFSELLPGWAAAPFVLPVFVPTET
jgi:hypothetical protein